MGNTIKKALTLLLLVATVTQASEIYFPNLQKNATGTTAAGSKSALDVNIASGSITLTEEATVADGGALPATVKIVGGYDGANAQVLKTDNTGSLQVDVESSALPSGAATAANQTSSISLQNGINAQLTTIQGNVDGLEASVDGVEASLSSIDGGTPAALGQAAMAASMPVVIASDQSAVPASQSGTWNINNVSGTVSLPTGAATAANQSTANTSLSSIDGKLAANYGAASGAVRTASQVGNASGVADFDAGASSAQTLRTTQASRTVSDRSRYDYTSNTVTTSGYTQVDSSLAAACNEIEIFDSSGQTMLLATGASSSEVDLLYIMPGGNGRVPVRLAASTRLSVKGVSSSANTGELTINCYN